MRLELQLALSQPSWTLEYRRMVAQWIQAAYQQACTDAWPQTMSRDFTFSVYLPEASFQHSASRCLGKG